LLREKLLQKARIHGLQAVQIPPLVAQDAIKAQEILSGLNRDVTLTEVAREYVERIQKREQSVSFSQLWREYRAEKTEISDAYQRQLDRVEGRILDSIGEWNVAEIEPGKLDSAMTVAFRTPAFFNSARACLRPAFNYALLRGYCIANPFDRIPAKRHRKPPAEILTVAQAKKVMSSCLDYRENKNLRQHYRVDCRDCLAAFALMLFAGIRPAEVARLRWAQIRLEDRELFVEARQSKTQKSTRFITIQENLLKWLEKVPKRSRKGLIVPSNWARKYKVVRFVSGIGKLQPDILRHSFGSYHLQAFGDVNQTRASMGHTVSDTLFAHYRAAVNRKDAEAFWQITPQIISNEPSQEKQ
jgi:integrase